MLFEFLKDFIVIYYLLRFILNVLQSSSFVKFLISNRQLLFKINILVRAGPILAINFFIVEINVFGALFWHEATSRPKFWPCNLSLIVNKSFNVFLPLELWAIRNNRLKFFMFRVVSHSSINYAFNCKAVLDWLPPKVEFILDDFNLVRIICFAFQNPLFLWLWAVNKLLVLLFQNVVHKTLHVLLMKLVSVEVPLWLLLLLKIFIVTVSFWWYMDSSQPLLLKPFFFLPSSFINNTGETIH